MYGFGQVKNSRPLLGPDLDTFLLTWKYELKDIWIQTDKIEEEKTISEQRLRISPLVFHSYRKEAMVHQPTGIDPEMSCWNQPFLFVSIL